MIFPSCCKQETRYIPSERRAEAAKWELEMTQQALGSEKWYSSNNRTFVMEQVHQQALDLFGETKTK